MNPDLAAFLEHARSKGMDPATTRMLLLAAGWKEKDVAKAVAEHALEMPVPSPPDTGGARDAFLHLTAFAALYAAAFAAVGLLFSFVNRLLPDPAFRVDARYAEGALSEDAVVARRPPRRLPGVPAPLALPAARDAPRAREGVERDPALADVPDPVLRGDRPRDRLRDPTGFKHFSQKNSLRLWIESNADECYRVFQSGLLPRRTLEGRIQRGLILYEEGLLVHDPMDFFEEITRHKIMQGTLPTENIYSPSQLDALMMAYVSWLAGNPAEKVLVKGDLFLPAPE